MNRWPMLAVFLFAQMYFSLTNHYRFDQNTKITLNP